MYPVTVHIIVIIIIIILIVFTPNILMQHTSMQWKPHAS